MENKKLEEFTEDEDILMSILDGEETEITLKSINPLEKMDIYQMHYMEDKHWYFKYKNEILEALIKKVVTKEDADILDIGVGTGTISKVIDSLGNAIHIEKNAEIIKYNNKVNPELNIENAEVPWNISCIENKKFDYIFLINIFEYIDNHRWILDVLKAYLKEDGKFIIATLSNSSMIGENDKAYGVTKKFSMQEIKELLTQELLISDYETFFENPTTYKKFSEATDKALREDDLYWNYISKENNILYDYYHNKEYKQVLKHGLKQGNQIFLVCKKMTEEDKKKVFEEKEKKKSERSFIDKMIDKVVDSREKKENKENAENEEE